MSNPTYLKARRRGYGQRGVNRLEIVQRFLIVCEGEKTEPNYFRQFRVPKLVVDVQGFGYNTVRLVQEAINKHQEARREGESYDQVWCVFDRDSFPAENFNGAIDLAKRANIEVAYSNEAFELWYLLHFVYLNTGISRQDYMERLEQYLGGSYKKNSDNVYGELLEKQPVAIANAGRLLAQYQPVRPVENNPSTTVHLLVEMLNRYSRR